MYHCICCHIQNEFSNDDAENDDGEIVEGGDDDDLEADKDGDKTICVVKHKCAGS